MTTEDRYKKQRVGYPGINFKLQVAEKIWQFKLSDRLDESNDVSAILCIIDEYFEQELIKEHERYDNLYSQFEEVCRQVQINKDKLERYENAYREEAEKLEKLRDDLRQSEIF